MLLYFVLLHTIAYIKIFFQDPLTFMWWCGSIREIQTEGEEMQITETDKQIMIKTARSSGAVGKNAILPRFIAEIEGLQPHLILDFGCGKEAIHVKALREQGFEFVFGKDLVSLSEPVYEVTQNLPWHLVYASNVLNVQPSIDTLNTTINMVSDYARYGVAYFSYPSSPRKLGYTALKIQDRLVRYFKSVYRFTYCKTVIFKCTSRKCQEMLERRLTLTND